MKLKAVQGKAIVVHLSDRIGVLADLAKVLADKCIDLLSVSAEASDGNGTIRLVTDDNLRAVDALKAANYTPSEADVVLLHIPHKPGTLHRISECLATSMIDVRHLTATAGEGGDSLVVVDTVDNERAMVALNAL